MGTETRNDERTRIDPMLTRFLEKLIGELGDVAARERVGRFAAPLETWHGRDVLDFIDRLREVTGDEYMGLGAFPCPLGTSEFVIEIAARCRNLREAIHTGFRLMKLVTAALSFELIEDGDRAVIEIRQAPSARDPDHVLADWAMIVWHKLSQWLIAAEIWLDRTEFAHPLDASYSGYATMFSSECFFNADASRLMFAASYLERRIVRTWSDGERLKRETKAAFTRQVGIARTWKQLVLNRLRADISEGSAPSTLEDLAAEFGVSDQTLRRRLRAEGASYRTLKAEVRREFALDVLADEQGTVGDASTAAGFAEPNALARALKSSLRTNAAELREQARRWRAGSGEPRRR
jgi:AraC-like DNA-binding protein